MTFLNLIVGTITLQIQGMNVEKFINFLIKNNIYIKDIKRNSYNNFYLKTNCFYYKKLLEQAGKLCYNISVVKTSGLYSIFMFLKSRLALTIIFGLGIVFVFISNLFVWQIKVYGNDRLSYYEISKLLKQNDIAVGSYKSTIDLDKIESLIYSNFEDVSLVSVAMYGSSLVVNIKEKLDVPSMKDSFEPLVAKQDGLITKITLISGTLNCSVGDVVKKGDILVYPFIADSQGQQKPIIALAEIEAYVDVIGRVEYNEIQTQYKRTGKMISTRYYSIFGLEFKLDKKSNTFENYHMQINQEYVFKNNFLPIKICTYTYYETAGTEIIIDFDNVKEEQIELSQQIAYKNLPQNIQVIEQNTLVSNDQNLYYIITYLKTVQSII